jgi:hypothetical protein
VLRRQRLLRLLQPRFERGNTPIGNLSGLAQVTGARRLLGLDPGRLEIGPDLANSA